MIYIVATPIGNLEDLTPRAARILATVDIIAAEDTRNTRKLLSHLGINLKASGKELVSYHDHNERQKAETLISRLVSERKTLAVVSDAGTPCIADPGFRIVQAARRYEVPVTPIPGPSSLTALVSASGLPSSRLLFIGFLPSKDKAIRAEMRTWAESGATIVFFESTRRLTKTLTVLSKFYSEATVVIGRELSKLFEEIVSLPVSEAVVWCQNHDKLRGEVTVVVDLGETIAAERQATLNTKDGVVLDHQDARQNLRREISLAFRSGATLKDLLGQMRDRGLTRAELYALLLDVKENG
jgi:16S rRNA (cytidine1402-2'-O)-methyltransferase